MAVFGMLTRTADTMFSQKATPNIGFLKLKRTCRGTNSTVRLLLNWDGK